MAEKWYETAGFGSDVIVSTRVRLARNVKGYPFSALLKPQALWEITEKVLGGMKLLEDSLHLHMRYVPLETMTSYEREKMVEQHLISPELTALMDYDRENGTQYYETFREYLLQERDIPRTSKALIIHRTTLLYRLQKIQSLICVNPDDPWQRLYLTFSLWLLEDKNRRQPLHSKH